MIYATGDTHGGWMHRLNMASFPEQKDMKKDDYVIILGDFGLWDDSRRERQALDWLEGRSFTTLFVDGNHENYDMLDAMPVQEWRGGKVHALRPSVLHLMRGQVFTIQDRRFFAFEVPGATTSKTAYWTHPRRTIAGAGGCWMPGTPSTASTTSAGGPGRCRRSRKWKRGGRTWPHAATRWTTSSPTAPLQG